MSFKKTATIVAAAGALAAISVPAMALENEFHGIYNMKYFVSNVENGSTADIDATKLGKDNKANNYFEQRARIQYIAKANDDLRLVTQFELDTKFGGDKTGKYGESSDAGVYDADGIMLETKHVYLDFNLGKSVNVKTGIQPIKDSVKGIFFDADAAGILVKSTMGPATLSTGYFRLATESSSGVSATGASLAQPTATSYFTSTSPIGHANTDLFTLDAKFAASKNVNVGAAYYLLADYANLNKTVHLVDVNADAKIGPATVSGFFAAETGYQNTSATKKKAISGYAANVAAKAAVGPGTAKTAFLFTSGDGDTNNGNNTQWANTGVVTYAEGGMFLLARTGLGGTTTDRTIIGSKGAGQKGVWLYTLGYDAAITPKFYTNVNAGFAWAAKNLNAPKGNATNYLGTEINLETGYKLYDNLTAKLQVGYVVLGGYYKNSAAGVAGDPENPYTVRTALSYAF